MANDGKIEVSYTFYSLVRTIPGADGFWKSRAELSYVSAGEKMVQAGMPEEQVLDILTELYWDTAECYGGC